MIEENQEIETKTAADGVAIDKFKAFVMSKFDVEYFKKVHGPDEYWQMGARVIRFRNDNKGGKRELTTKLRKSESSTMDRQEIDVPLGKGVSDENLRTFLTNIGYDPAFTIIKSAYIFSVKFTANVSGTIVLYDVYDTLKPDAKKRFIEVEIDKLSEITLDTAKRHVRNYTKLIQEEFKLGEPLNQSLFEIFNQLKEEK